VSGRSLRPLSAAALAAALVVGLARPTAAQMGPGGFGSPGGMQPPPPGGNQEKEEGPAEEAPEENRPADLEPLGEYAEQNKKRMQIFELDGYLRLRSDYMHNFALGQSYNGVTQADPANGVNYGLPPFPLPLECPVPTATNPISPPTTPGSAAARCPHDSIGGANLRLRIEPTINVTDQVRVHAQIDVIDNTILGSTPDSLAGIPGYNVPPATSPTMSGVSPTSLPGVAPSGFLYTTQDPPEVGQNGFVSSIRAKRAWAEVDSEFGSLRFGRMPWQWGRGIFYNSGGCADCDVGTTVDRVMALTTIYGHQFAAAWDLGSQGPTTQQLTLGRTDPNGYQYDLSQNDDVLQLMASVTRMDDPVALRERIDRGDIVVNYGLQVVYRNQGNTSVPQNSPPPPGGAMNGPQPQTPAQVGQETYFGALSVTPDAWLKLYYKTLTVEFEGIGIFGRIDQPGALSADGNQRLTLRQLGWVAAGELRLYRESFFIGLETGGATGDEAEQPGQYLNYRWHFVQQPSGDHQMNDFHFSPDYHVDEILWRHIYGTVTNAIYFKPQAAYWFDLGRTRSIGVMGAAIWSLAQVPVSTPGNSINYGIETDLGAGYRNTAEGFYAGLTWGILWPLGALDRPQSIWQQYAANASVAQILRVVFGVKF
jgi:uncharacterized protein (TIGR04551 family)